MRKELYNLEMEQQVIGSIFLDEKSITDIKSFLVPSDFFEPRHKEIYSSIISLYDKGKKIDYSIVLDDLQKKKIIHNANENEYANYVLGLANSVPSVVNLIHYIGIVSSYSQKRNGLRELVDLTDKLESLDINDIEEKLKSIADKFNDNTDFEHKDGFTNLSDYIDEYLIDLETPVNPDDIFKLGFDSLDELVVLEKTNLMVIGADTGVGKTAFALNIVNNLCIQGKKTFFVSQEMGRKEVMRRVLALIANVKAQSLKRKELTKEDYTKIMSAKSILAKRNIRVYDKGNMSIEMLYAIVSRLKRQNQIEVLVVDYLQLIESKKNKGSRVNEVAYVSRKLKQIAMEFEIPVILLSQLNRSIVNQDGKVREPQKSDLKESSSIEQDANIILMLHTTDVEQKYQYKRFIDLFIRKQRDGVLGKVRFAYYGDYVKFVESKWDDTVSRYVDVDPHIKTDLDF